MSTLDEAQVKEVLKTVQYPGFSRDIVSFGLVKEVKIDGGNLTVQMALSTNEPGIPKQIRDDAEKALAALPGVSDVKIKIDIQAPAQTTGSFGPAKIDGVKNIIAIASGKGGVGKSTVASNLSLALQDAGWKVGLCDCDIYGPSVAMMFGGNERPMADEQDRIIPIQRYGLQLMSMGFLLDDASPAVLRGPMVTRYTQQFLQQVAWSDLDCLILDLPPGTGDIQLTIVQTVALTGAVVVTTPQEVALIDARKAVTMFGKTSVPVLGIVENMSYFLCPSDGERYNLFGEGGGKREADRLQVPLLGQIPIEMQIREGGDTGSPVYRENKDSESSKTFANIARQVQVFCS
ncbi:MAG: Mrp/NBP35 family ATP-binding protein [Chthoniobacterales bacterium]